jgi:hypothetical protein
LPIGLQTFSEIISGEMLYIDKTKHIQMFVDTYKYAFVARPRRFGKSLFISTLEEFFKGNKELFKGLDIYDCPKWDSYPIIRLDFSRTSNQTAELLEISISERLLSIAKENDVTLTTAIKSDYISNLIDELYSKYGKRVVILIDEYDKPLTDHFTDIKMINANRDVLRSLYSSIKSLDNKIQFMFITGISRFAKLSLFSGLNQIYDLTLNSKFSSLFGCSQEELLLHFSEYFPIYAKKLNMSEEHFISELRHWYNGYSWDAENFLYNPFSLLCFFSGDGFSNYWFSTGTPNFLVKLIKANNYDIFSFRNYYASESSLDTNDFDQISLSNLLFQTGYFTIKKKKFVNGRLLYGIDFPNYEVQESLFGYLFADITSSDYGRVAAKSTILSEILENEQFDEFLDTIKSLFAQIPSNLHISQEKFYHSLFIMIMYMSRIQMESEVNTNIGRIDGVIEFADKIYIIEFKYNLPPEDGLKQIKEKKYYEKYLASGKRLIMIGVSFTREEINLKFEV